MAGNAFYRLGRITGVQFRKATWMWQSVVGSEADAIQAEHGVGRDLAMVVLEEMPRDLDQTTQALLDEVEGKLTPVARNRLHRFQMTAVDPDRSTAFALPCMTMKAARRSFSFSSFWQQCERGWPDSELDGVTFASPCVIAIQRAMRDVCAADGATPLTLTVRGTMSRCAVGLRITV